MANKLMGFKTDWNKERSFRTDRLPTQAGESGTEANEERGVTPGATQAVGR